MQINDLLRLRKFSFFSTFFLNAEGKSFQNYSY